MKYCVAMDLTVYVGLNTEQFLYFLSSSSHESTCQALEEREHRPDLLNKLLPVSIRPYVVKLDCTSVL